MSWVKFFWCGEICATQVPRADVAGYRALPSHGTQESNSTSLTAMRAREQSWQRTRWQDVSYQHTAPCQGRSREGLGVHATEKSQDQPHQGWLLPPLALSRGNHTLKVTLIQCEG